MEARTGDAASQTFTRSGRRAQIVAAAIEVIAEVGSAGASFARIADHAGLSSTGMISYHFHGKDDLFTACVAEIERVTEESMRSRLDAAEGYVERVRAYVEANVALVGEHPAAVRALIDLVTTRRACSASVDRRIELFIDHFQRGQAAGDLAAFDPPTVAAALTGGLDAVVARLAAATPAPTPDELARVGRDLAGTYARAIAARSPHQEAP